MVAQETIVSLNHIHKSRIHLSLWMSILMSNKKDKQLFACSIKMQVRINCLITAYYTTIANRWSSVTRATLEARSLPRLWWGTNQSQHLTSLRFTTPPSEEMKCPHKYYKVIGAKRAFQTFHSINHTAIICRSIKTNKTKTIYPRSIWCKGSKCKTIWCWTGQEARARYIRNGK